MRVLYSDHVRRRMRKRKITTVVVKHIVEKPDKIFQDTVTGYKVFVKRLFFREKHRLMAVSVDEKVNVRIIVTVHPIRERDLTSRSESKRWI